MINLAKEGDVLEDAIVIELGTRSLDVIVPRFGIEKRIWVEDLVEEGLVRGCHLEGKSMSLKIHWNKPDLPADTDLAESIENLQINQENILDGDTSKPSGESLAGKDKDKKTGSVKVQAIRMFDAVRVKVIPLMERSPPQIKLLIVYPEKEIPRSVFAVVQDALVASKESPSLNAQAMASCPAMADDRD